MSHPVGPQTPPLRPLVFNSRPQPPHLCVVDTSLSPDGLHHDDLHDQPCSPLTPVSASPWEDASAASTTASIPSTPTTQVSVNEPLPLPLPASSFPLLSKDMSSKIMPPLQSSLLTSPLPSPILLSSSAHPKSEPESETQAQTQAQTQTQTQQETQTVKIPPESMGGPIRHIPPKWALRGDIYTFSFWTPASAARNLPEHAYSPLEGKTSFADEAYSRPVGGLSMIQILSYRDSPVGPYDEMLVAPGSFDWERTEEDGTKTRGSNPKITRIYVSTPNSCFNGRTNWNTPKHLAKFVWDHHPDGSTTIQIFPHDAPSHDGDESRPSSTPFFTTTFKPMPLAPRFPFATSWVDHLGFNTTLVMPPLPPGKGTYGELPSTSRWISLVTKQFCKRSTMGWYDVRQPDDGSGDGRALCGGNENFLPWLGRWQVGLKMEDADLTFEIPDETWETGDKLSDGDHKERMGSAKTTTPTTTMTTTMNKTMIMDTTTPFDEPQGKVLEKPRSWGSGNFLYDYFT
ncbi:hypothetical protein A9Z42_0032840 [Trichoderma parareesei]|uniref:Uncharacterized protein n=2 Tax=Trichoderma TaxID=5543 RepID=A0A2H2Z3Q8_TRIPA|nr:hypothetical protein A9Z42_0032840 [Trichoderma parareesei]